jgi:predicted nucleic acid-binding protein
LAPAVRSRETAPNLVRAPQKILPPSPSPDSTPPCGMSVPMSHLLDVNALIALIWPSHVHYTTVRGWRPGKKLVICPITELGFIRVSTSPAFSATMTDARKALQHFLNDEKPDFIAADARALEGTPATSSNTTTDFYLCQLAANHGLKLATLDVGIRHAAAEVIT